MTKKINDFATLLVCNDKNAIATKTFTGLPDPLHFTATPPNAFNVMNGEIWFNEDGSSFTIKPHSPDSGFRFCMDAYYNPEAKAPQFEQFESGIFRDNSQSEDCINLMREILAYACMEWKNIATIVILHGEGGNGKTRYGVLLQKLLGEKFIHSGDVSSIEKNRFQLASLVNKKVFIDDDVKQGIILADGTLKKISERKAQTAEHKNKDPFDFVLNLVPILMTNHLIRVNDKSNGMKRRLVTIPFKREFLPHEQVINLIENIWEAESSGVLNLIIEAGLNLMQRKRFNPPLECEELRNQFLNLDTPLNEYINNTYDRIDEKYVHFEEFLNGFMDYHNIVATLDTTFKQSIEDSLNRAGFEVKNHSNKRFIKGLAPKMLAFESQL